MLEEGLLDDMWKADKIARKVSRHSVSDAILFSKSLILKEVIVSLPSTALL